MRRARLTLLLLAFPAASAHAQLRGTLDVGASHVNEAGVPSASGLSAGGTLDAVASRGWLRASALGVSGTGVQSSVQGLVAGALDLRESGLVRPFLGASGSFFTQTALGHSTSAELSAGARLIGVARGVSLAASTGLTNSDGTARSVYRALSDAWITTGVERFSVELALTSSQARFVDGVPDSTAAASQRYIDGVVGWRHERDGLSFGVSGGVRNRTSAASGGAWGIADVGLWVTSRVALAVTAGNSLEDVVRGIPRTTYVTAALRIATQPHLTVFGRAAPAGPRMIARVIDDDRQIEVLGVNASRVEIMADFTEWQPVELERAGTIWRLERRMLPGPHRVALRLDGGDWIVPSNLPRVDDDLGGAVGVITIP